MTHTEPCSSVSSLAEESRNRPPRSWFVTRHRCHFVRQALCLAIQTTMELARIENTTTAKSPGGSVGDAAPAEEWHGWSGAATAERHATTGADSLGRRRVGPQRSILGTVTIKPSKICCDRLDAHLVASRFSKICSGGGGNSRLSWPSKICCDWPKARLVTSKFSKIVLGGTAAPYIHRVWGAVIF